MEGFAERLHRDMELERGLIAMDLIPPPYAKELRKEWLERRKRRK